MPQYFADTWYFIAVGSRFDQDYQAALRLERALAAGSLVTHDGVFMEMLAYFSGFGADQRLRATVAVRRLLSAITVLPADRGLFLAALDLYERRRDKEYSLVDCMSMVVMRERGITHVLTNDHHFRQEGFTVLSDAP